MLPPKLKRLAHNTKASDFCCLDCRFWYQLKGQKTRLGRSVTDGGYEAMMQAMRKDETPNFLFMHYDLASWTIQNLLLIPHFAFPPSAIIKRNPLSATARRAGWVGCNIALDRIPAEARIGIVNNGRVTSPAEVRAQFRRVKPLADVGVKERGWLLDVLNAVRRLPQPDFRTGDMYVFERELASLHANNRNIRAKIRQKLQELRDTGLLLHVGRDRWRRKFQV